MDEEAGFWESLEQLLREGRIVIDRPRGGPHPHHPDLIYPLDYGYLEDTTAADGGGIDIWIGSLPERSLTGILVSYDEIKRDVEIKLLLGCAAADVEQIRRITGKSMRYLFIPHPANHTGDST